MSTSATNFGPVKITETVLRDAHQSLLATRMRTEQMLPMLSALDKIGYNALEAWGGATYDSCLRFLNEDPRERRDPLTATLTTPSPLLLRGQNLLGYNHYSDDVVRAFVRKASEHGVGVFRIFDALNDVTNLKTAISAALEAKEKPHVQGCLVYTISPFHTNQTFVDLAIKLKEMGVHSICIKDMSGLLKPYVAEDLVKKLKEQVGLPIELHTHYTSGFGSMTYLKAIEAGVDIIDCALSPLANDTSQPCTETIVATLEGMPRDTGLDRQAGDAFARRFLKVKKVIMKSVILRGCFDGKAPKMAYFRKELAAKKVDKKLAPIEANLASVDAGIYEQVRDTQIAKMIDEIPEEDVLSYALFPQVALDFFEKNGRL